MTPRAVPFAASEAMTLGVEWELALVDRATRDLTNAAGEVIGALREAQAAGRAPATRVADELLRNTVEVVSGVHRSAGEAAAEVAAGVRALQA